MRVAEIMHTDVQTIAADALIQEVVERLAEGHVTGLPVVDRGRRLLGVVSTSDLLEAEAAAVGTRDRDVLFENTEVSEIMTARPLTVTPETSVREAAQQMLYAEVHRLFVESEGKLVGVISQTDIVRAVAQGRL
jgi:acetoin utilization protein AcuB